MYWRGLCRPQRGQRGHTESHSWLVSLVRTRREDGDRDRGNVSAHGHSKGLETVSLKVEKKNSYKLRVKKEKERSLVESRSLAGTVVIIREGKLEQITLKL